MTILISLAAAVLFTAVCGASLRKKPVPYYAAALAVSLFFAAAGIAGLRFPPFINRWIVPVFARGGLAGALFILVMYAGAVPNGSRIQKTLLPIRGQLSIIASIFALGHGVYSGKSYLMILLDKMRTFSSIQLAVFTFSVLMIAVMIPLFVTSFMKIRRKMDAKRWKKLQRGAYVFYGLIYLHILLLMLPKAMRGEGKYALSVAVYSAVFLGYFAMRVNKALARKGKRSMLPAAAAVCAMAVFAGLSFAPLMPKAEAEDLAADVSKAAPAQALAQDSGSGNQASAAAGESEKQAGVLESGAKQEAAAGESAPKAEQPAGEVLTAKAEDPAADQAGAKQEEPTAGVSADQSSSAQQDPAQSALQSGAAGQDAAEQKAAQDKAPAAPAEPKTQPDPAKETPSASEPQTPTAPAEPKTQPDPAKETPAASEPAPARTYKDGTYSGTAVGNEGNITVSVTIQDDRIASIAITSFGDDLEYFDPAKEGASMISRMISCQTYSVDTISGATYSSKGLRDAVKKALAAANN